MINRNCTCSREPLMALNLHQARRGGSKRKSQERKHPASDYTAELHSHRPVDSHTHTHIDTHVYIYMRIRLTSAGDCGTPGPSTHHVNQCSVPFHFKCITFQTFPHPFPPSKRSEPAQGEIPAFRFNKPLTTPGPSPPGHPCSIKVRL